MNDGKKFDVYGIGNALVDKEFEVEDRFFAEHAIEKGMMTLVEESRQDHLLHILEQGFPLKSQSGGGSAANTLYALSQFGGTAFFSCRVADDDNGRFYLQQLGSHNIRTNLSRHHDADPASAGTGADKDKKTLNNRYRRSRESGNPVLFAGFPRFWVRDAGMTERIHKKQGKTGRCLVMISPDAERTMLSYLGVSADLSERELDLQAAKDSRYVYLEGYLVTSPDAKRTLMHLKEFAAANGVPIAMTFSDPAMLEYYKDDVNAVLGSGVDLLFCNEREALLWSGTATLADACAALQGKARRFAVTRGGDGALLFDGDRFIEIPPHPVQAVDTNGAGDMFAGAFLYALTQGRDFPTAGHLASLASATTVSHYGPRLTPDAHQRILREFDRN